LFDGGGRSACFVLSDSDNDMQWQADVAFVRIEES
jgi:hypothetical protein